MYDMVIGGKNVMLDAIESVCIKQGVDGFSVITRTVSGDEIMETDMSLFVFGGDKSYVDTDTAERFELVDKRRDEILANIRQYKINAM